MTLAVVPARGGSQGLRRKNLLPVDGVPMVLRTARAAQAAGCTVVVSTDDDQIAAVAQSEGFTVHSRGPDLADVPVDEVVAAVCADMGWDGRVLLAQPTVQPITSALITEFLDSGAGPVTMVTPARHQLFWRGKRLTEFVNRQGLTEIPEAELGIRWWPSPDMIGHGLTLKNTKQRRWTVDGLIDIDTADDWRAAQPKKRIVFAPIVGNQYGRGHLHRCLTIAERVQHHDVAFHKILIDTQIAHIVSDRGWDLVDEGTADLYVADNLGKWMPERHPRKPVRENIRARLVLSLEDKSRSGDVTINALYEDGADWAVLRPEFLHGDYQVRDGVRRVMVMFGGTDPHHIGQRIVDLLDGFTNSVSRYDVDWVRAGDDVPVAERMRQADLLVTSAGRTVFEAAAVGVPTIVLAQNLRETTHTHLGFEHGNVYLGLAQVTTDQTIIDTVRMVAGNHDLRKRLSRRGRPDGRGVDRIVHTIEGMLGGL